MQNRTKYTSLFETIQINNFVRQILTVIERTVYYKRQRWSYLFLFYIHVLYRFYVYEYLGLMYFIGLYVINLIVRFFTPQGLPDPDEDTDQSPFFFHQSISILTSKEGDRPIVRSLNQFNLWKSLCVVGLAAWTCTWFDVFLIPVYWPFLLIYFTWLIGLAVVKHCIHMKKYGYRIKDFDEKKQVYI